MGKRKRKGGGSYWGGQFGSNQKKSNVVKTEESKDQPPEPSTTDAWQDEELDIMDAYVSDLIGGSAVEELLDRKFYLIGTNVMLPGMPLEIGIVEYSIRHGVHRHLHDFLDPGPIPQGMYCRAKEHQERYHKIPFSNFSEAVGQAVSDPKLRASLLEQRLLDYVTFFSSPAGRDEEPMLLFTHIEHIKQVEDSLKAMAKQCSDDIREDLDKLLNERLFVLDVASLLYYCCDKSGNKRLLETCYDNVQATTYEYTPAVSCTFHDNMENKWCALGLARRIAFNLAEVLCHCFDIKPTAKHLPTMRSQSTAAVNDDDLEWG